jgi:uncharacterized FAD-dependent dehydrogenase
MLRLSDLSLPLNHDSDALRACALGRLGVADAALRELQIVRRSQDARKRHDIRLIYTVDVKVDGEAGVLGRLGPDARIAPAPDRHYRFVAQAPAQCNFRPVIIGTGPCGLLAGLLFTQMGFRPMLFDRGRAVRDRTADTIDLWKRQILHPDSNVQFGEGGAGTFSDGKLYTQIKDPLAHGRKVLEAFVAAGASPEILTAAKPHIGTSRLVALVERMRETIIASGGEFHFEKRLTQLLSDRGAVTGVAFADGTRLDATCVILAVGHSARDTFAQLHADGIRMEPKAFSIGVRIEHPQAMIDRACFGSAAGHPALGRADYKVVHHARNGRGVYSFCMCPGGTVVAATSEPGCVVTNGMSQPARDAVNANAALVVGVSPDDFGDPSPLAGIAYQRQWERLAFEAGGGDYRAPAQRVGDFLAGRPSTRSGAVVPSYAPGVRWTDLTKCLPPYVIDALREAIPAFERRIRGFAMDDAVLTAVETRTSAPLRILRDPETLESVSLHGLYPAGEGAGYAGGILSAAMDGIKVAEVVACQYGVFRGKLPRV